MKFLWTDLKGSEGLQTNVEAVIARAADAAVRELELDGRFAELERARLARLAREWLEVEKQRKPFKTVFLEHKQQISISGLELSGRIDRMDRVTVGETSEHVLIDYKTGNPNPKVWEGPRPDEPQLTLYAISNPTNLSAVVFARLRPGDMRFMGFSKDKDALPGVNQAKSWPDLLAAWRREAESLGAAFAAGEAHVDPKNDLGTCRLCDLQTLCRVYEKYSALEGDAE